MTSVDATTEAIMQEVIDTNFAHYTILAVVHRLGYVRRFDKVALLHGGELAEFDGPDALLATEGSLFADLYKAGGYEGSSQD